MFAALLLAVSALAAPSGPTLLDRCREAAPELRAEPLEAALAAWRHLSGDGLAARPRLAVIDYGLPSTVPRLWVFDLEQGRLLYRELVAHGRGSGEDLATVFSDVPGSFTSSLGAFVTGETYTGRNGYSLRLRGVEPERNRRAEERAIVVHGAAYVGEATARALGRLGRSHGCPAVRPEIARRVIDDLKDRAVLYAWHPSLRASGPGA